MRLIWELFWFVLIEPFRRAWSMLNVRACLGQLHPRQFAWRLAKHRR